METHEEPVVIRPWGSFKVIGKFSGRITVKIVKINPNSRLSLQYHEHRDEEWTVLSGRATATVGDRKYHMNVGDRATAFRAWKHRLESDIGSELLEVSYGDFDEEDIVRLGDDYGRTSHLSSSDSSPTVGTAASNVSRLGDDDDDPDLKTDVH
jgi:mannose-6-phosphate isomerase-like protein (cupin superfamily)